MVDQVVRLRQWAGQCTGAELGLGDQIEADIDGSGE